MQSTFWKSVWVHFQRVLILLQRVHFQHILILLPREHVSTVRQTVDVKVAKFLHTDAVGWFILRIHISNKCWLLILQAICLPVKLWYYLFFFAGLIFVIVFFFNCCQNVQIKSSSFLEFLISLLRYVLFNVITCKYLKYKLSKKPVRLLASQIILRSLDDKIIVMLPWQKITVENAFLFWSVHQKIYLFS